MRLRLILVPFPTLIDVTAWRLSTINVRLNLKVDELCKMISLSVKLARDGLQLVSKFMNTDTKIESSPNKYRLVLKKLR